MPEKTIDYIGDIKELEGELNELISKIKPNNVLSIGDKFMVSKDVEIINFGKIKKGTQIEIIDIIQGIKKNQTTAIHFTLDGDKENVIKMSSGIFIINFCEKIDAKSKKIRDRISQLRKEIKQQKKNLEQTESQELTENVKSEVNWILSLLKTAKKKFKKKLKKHK